MTKNHNEANLGSSQPSSDVQGIRSFFQINCCIPGHLEFQDDSLKPVDLMPFFSTSNFFFKGSEAEIEEVTGLLGLAAELWRGTERSLRRSALHSCERGESAHR